MLLSDIHGNLKVCEQAVKTANKLKAPIIIAGDLMNWEYRNPGNRFKKTLKILDKCKKNVYVIPGSHEDVKNWLQITDETSKYRKIIDFNRKIIDMKSFYLIGYGGSNTIVDEIIDKTYFRISPKKDELMLDKLLKKSRKPIVFVSHIPPYSYLDVAVFKKIKTGKKKLFGIYPAKPGEPGARTKHVGSRVLKKIVEKNRPLLHVFGHIHESAGFEELITHKKKNESRHLMVNAGMKKIITVNIGKTARVEKIIQV